MSFPTEFTRHRSSRDEINEELSVWIQDFRSKSKAGSKMSCSSRKASSIATQILISLSQPHAHLFCAKKDEKIRAVMIVDDRAYGYELRFIVSNILDPEARGAGTFLVDYLKGSLKVGKKIILTPENSRKFWLNSGFSENPIDPCTMVYPPCLPEVRKDFKRR
jgi:hypothetical protein